MDTTQALQQLEELQQKLFALNYALSAINLDAVTGHSAGYRGGPRIGSGRSKLLPIPSSQSPVRKPENSYPI